MKKKLKLHEQIRNHLMTIIKRSRPGERLPTVRDLHQIFKCSHSTISMALSDLEKHGYIERHVGRGLFVANREKRIMAEQKKETMKGNILFTFPDYFSFEFWTILKELETLAMRGGFNLVQVKMQIGSNYNYLFSLYKNTPAVVGLVILPSGTPLHTKVMDKLEELEVPSVILGVNSTPQKRKMIHYVHPDYFNNGYQLASHLIRSGRQKIAYIHNEPSSPPSSMRLKGIKEAFSRHRVPWSSLIRAEWVTLNWEFAADSAYEAVANLAREKDPPDAYLFDSMLGALAGHRALCELGVQIPADVALVADGELAYSDYLYPRFTGIEFSTERLVSKAFKLLINRASSSHIHTIPTVFKLGESSTSSD